MIYSTLKYTLPALLLLHAPIALGQTITFQELLQKQEEWPKFAVEGRKFQFEGRFEGRTANTIKMTRFDIVCHLPSSATFPDGIRNGQRIEVIGRFLAENEKLVFIVSRIVIKDTDVDRLRTRARDVPADQPERLLDIAAEYQADADFYDDVMLQKEIAAIRTAGIRQLRGMARGDVTKLTELLRQSRSLGINSELIQSLQFEKILAAAKQPNTDVDVLVTEIKASCPGWDRIVPPIPERLQIAFDKDPVATFVAASETDRQALHRLLYRSLRLRQIQAMLKTDGSNGMELSRLVRTEFGGDDPLAADLEDREVRFRMAQLPSLSRSELKELTDLLTSLHRAQQIPDTARVWLLAQEQRFGTSNLAGMLRTADEYLFVADLVSSDEYQQRGVELLKKAWDSVRQSSPTDADHIADRLQRLGWERLNDVWITKDQMKSLPHDDIQLAIREGRVLRGMTVEQVVQTLGQPTGISRIASRRSVIELWSFKEEGSSGMVVRFRRSVADPTSASIVEDVSPTGRR